MTHCIELQLIINNHPKRVSLLYEAMLYFGGIQRRIHFDTQVL